MASRWGHAVNSGAALVAALAEARPFLEADVCLHAGTPTMAHPPITPASAPDLDLAEFLARIEQHNARAQRQEAGRAEAARPVLIVKLDFKDPAAVPLSLATIRDAFALDGLEGTELWLNADILAGPGGRPSPFDAHDFVSTCLSEFPAARLSLGWTVSTAMPWALGYSDAMVDQMAAVCAEHGVVNVTFACQAVHARLSTGPLDRLLAGIPGATVTLWGEADSTTREWAPTSFEGRNYVDIKDASLGLELSIRLGRLFGLIS